MFRTIRTARLVVALCVLAGISVTTIVGFVTGFIQDVTARIVGLVQTVWLWISSISGEQLLTIGGGIAAAVLGLLFLWLLITDS